ncbi:hypothetical protein BGZ83_011952 [Gryganskiella cystojenkinii]|nr:hypothetical protein BGZ83_011952 [Gryganskiella cystojenkinii]
MANASNELLLKVYYSFDFCSLFKALRQGNGVTSLRPYARCTDTISKACCNSRLLYRNRRLIVEDDDDDKDNDLEYISPAPRSRSRSIRSASGPQYDPGSPIWENNATPERDDDPIGAGENQEAAAPIIAVVPILAAPAPGADAAIRPEKRIREGQNEVITDENRADLINNHVDCNLTQTEAAQSVLMNVRTARHYINSYLRAGMVLVKRKRTGGVLTEEHASFITDFLSMDVTKTMRETMDAFRSEFLELNISMSTLNRHVHEDLEFSLKRVRKLLPERDSERIKPYGKPTQMPTMTRKS